MLRCFQLRLGFLIAGLISITANAQETDLTPLKLETWPQLYISDLDGGNITKLFPNNPGRSEEAPSLSQDGKKLAFESRNGAEGERKSESVVYLVDLESGEQTKLMKGAMPELSPEGHRIFFSRFDDRGVWVANVDRLEETLIQLDSKGWGTGWSTDGKKLAWASFQGSYNFKIIDLVEGTEWTVFAGEKSPFRIIYYQFAWSPDSRYLIFKGDTHDQKSGIYAVDVLEERQPVPVVTQGQFHNSFAWHPDGSRVLISQPHPETKQLNLYWIEPLKPDKDPVRVEKIPPELNVTDPCFTPDGKQIIFAASVAASDDAGKKENDGKVIP